MSADVGIDRAVGCAVVSCASVVLGTVQGRAVSTQQLPRAKVTRYGHCHRGRAAFQPVAVAVPVAEATRDPAQKGLRPLPVSEKFCTKEEIYENTQMKVSRRLRNISTVCASSPADEGLWYSWFSRGCERPSGAHFI